jgi:methyltransferase (TIGR00027 family)
MKPGKPSLTATWVAAWRGVASAGSDPVARDDLAESLVPAPYRQILAAARRAPRATDAILRLADVVSAGRSAHLPLRTRAIDEAVATAIARGARQLVVLGAGLDARAFRLDALDGVVAYEVDHPVMQAYKRSKVESLPRRARDVRFVTTDFEQEDLAPKLAAAGHDAASPSVFVWEGVTMYLTRDAIDRTLRGVAARAAVGSTIVATYFLPAKANDAAILRWVLANVRERIESEFAPPEIAAVLAAHGFSTTSDEGDPEWSARWLGRDQPWALERIVTARKT